MYTLDDTIAAIATPLGVGGIGIVRLSGPRAHDIPRACFVSADGSPLAHRRLVYGYVIDPADGRRVDEVLATVMVAPATYTRQDVAEIHAHGGMVALRAILALCLAQGARLAEPGEFTLRAFLLGRVDLAQAEAVLDVVLVLPPPPPPWVVDVGAITVVVVTAIACGMKGSLGLNVDSSSAWAVMRDSDTDTSVLSAAPARVVRVGPEVSSPPPPKQPTPTRQSASISSTATITVRYGLGCSILPRLPPTPTSLQWSRW